MTEARLAKRSMIVQVCPDGTAALAAERAIRARALRAGPPYLNPL